MCNLPLGERFVLWALRQWRHDQALPTEGSPLHRGFQMAGLLAALPDFAIAMDAFLFGARRAMEIHLPTCSKVSRDEATVVALCGLAQGDLDGPMLASLDDGADRLAGCRDPTESLRRRTLERGLAAGTGGGHCRRAAQLIMPARGARRRGVVEV